MKTFLCKAILNTPMTSVIGKDWATSKRTLLKVSSDHLEAGDTRILFSEIESAALKIVPSAFFLPGCILTIVCTGGITHHFGLRYSSFWRNHLPFAVERSTVSVPLLWLRRMVILAILLSLFWEFFGRYVF